MTSKKKKKLFSNLELLINRKQRLKLIRFADSLRYRRTLMLKNHEHFNSTTVVQC